MRRYRTRVGLQFGNESIAARRRNVGLIDFMILLGNAQAQLGEVPTLRGARRDTRVLSLELQLTTPGADREWQVRPQSGMELALRICLSQDLEGCERTSRRKGRDDAGQ